MSARPGSAQPQAPSPASAAKPSPSQTTHTVPSSLRGPAGMGPAPKNFGPPSLQLPSDTVIFQAAKIPVSSARLATAPGSAGLLASGRGGGAGAYSSGREMDHRRGQYGGSAGASRVGYDRSSSPPRRHPAEMGVRHLQQRTADHPSPHSGGLPPQRRPRSPPPPASRDRVNLRRHQDGDLPLGNGSTSARGPPAGLRDSGGHGGAEDGGEFTHLLMENDLPGGARARPSTETASGPPAAAANLRATNSAQRQSRPSSADSKTSASGRGGVARLTVRVMKDGDKLGFGIRNDSNRKLKVSTLQTNSTAAKSTLKIGDTILSVNGIDLTDMGFLEVIQQLKATKPGELVFDIERSLDEDESLSGAEGSQQGETMDLDSPLSVAERRFGPLATRSSPGSKQQAPPQRRPEAVQMSHPPQRTTANPAAPAPVSQQRGGTFPDGRIPIGMPGGSPVGRERVPPQQAQTGDNLGPSEPPRKRPRPAAMTPAQVEMELTRLDKQHRAVMNALSMELKKERTEKLNLEEKNTALRKRLQNMLIECDEVRVKANSTVATIKEHAQRDIHELRQALQAARAQLRLQDRGPDVARTDSIVNDLVTTKEQLSRLRKVEMERATNLSNRYSLESRQAEREASRTRERLIDIFIGQLRDVARRNYNNNGVRTGGKEGNGNVVVHWEGLRRLAFVKMFGLPCSYEWYTSDDYYSTSLIRHLLPKQDDVMDIFGNTLCHEERAGLFVVASAPMNVAYDPTTEKLTLSCSWAEQNQLRELARNFRF